MTAFADMSKVLLAEKPSYLLRKMGENGTLGDLFPEIQRVIDFRTKKASKNLWEHTLQVVDQTPPSAILRWAALFHDVGKPVVVKEDGKVTFYGHEAVGAKIWEKVAKRLKVDFRFFVLVATVILYSGEFAAITDNRHVSVTDGAVRRFIRNVGKEHIHNIYLFAMADMTTANEAKERRMKAALTTLKERMDRLIYEDEHPLPKLPKKTGTLIMEGLGIKGGPELGKIMKELTEKLQAGRLSLTSDFVKEARKILDEDGERT